MNSPQTESRLGLTLAAWFLAIVGWTGVIVATNFNSNSRTPLALLHGVVRRSHRHRSSVRKFLHRRFTGHNPSEGVALREAIWSACSAPPAPGCNWVAPSTGQPDFCSPPPSSPSKPSSSCASAVNGNPMTLRQLPSVETLLQASNNLIDEYGRPLVLDALRRRS